MRLRHLLVAVAALTSFATAPAAAAIQVWLDEAAFNAATSGLTTYTIPNLGEGEVDVTPAVFIGPVLFASDDYLSIFNDGTYGAPYLEGSGLLIAGLVRGSAIGFHIASWYGNDIAYLLGDVTDSELNFVEQGILAGLDPTEPRFIGFTGFTGFGVVAFGNDGLTDIIDFSTDATIPEPATWALMIGGFLMVGAMARRRRSVLAA